MHQKFLPQTKDHHLTCHMCRNNYSNRAGFGKKCRPIFQILTFNKSFWGQRSNINIFLESVRPKYSISCVKSEIWRIWKFSKIGNFREFLEKKTAQNFFGRQKAMDISISRGIHIKNFSSKSWSIVPNSRFLDFSHRLPC